MVTNHNPFFVGFYHEYEENGCYSNWYPTEFDLGGIHFSNTEQYMMYQKAMLFGAEELANRILEAKTPAECKTLGKEYIAGFDGKVWDEKSIELVKPGIKEKFRQNPDLLKELLSTGNALLAECAPYDKKWGIGIAVDDPRRFNISKWSGKNYLGIILMQVREELRQENKT